MHAVATVTWGAAVGLALGQLTELKTMELELNAYDTILLYVPRVMNVQANSLPYKRDEEEGDDESYGSGNSEDRQEQRLQAVFSEDYFQQIIRLLTALARLPALKSLSLRDYYSQPVRHEYVTRSILNMVFHTPEVFGKRLGDVQYRNPLPHMSIEAVCIALLTHAKFSLRHLDIELLENGSMCGCRHEPFLEPYRPYLSINPTAPPTTNWRWNEFTQLERLTLDIHLFSNLEGNGWLPFAQTLPASIQDVVILAPRCPPGADMLDFQNMFHDFNPQNFSIFRPINAVATSTLGL
ncbi:putative GPI anchored protein [Aspergillus fumigatus Af293]|uniref:GPI anchored protein, putative n=1 Tax=Aspergillus fumigatus (strain ATCC MYA-4609 / CBS 101355 / FGSC A1100 / Af293) TaxID=330879 RepID=Q4W8X9_ASPFU|nr:GPI anchored protein, putative [Aspergillus fumigatus Af293]EAL84240.1 GPI anchored protein, putative [Aspergillus fumigatus Af293]